MGKTSLLPAAAAKNINMDTMPQMEFRPDAKKPLIVGDEVFLSAIYFHLTAEESKKARAELPETEEKKKRCIQELRRRIANDGMKCRTDDGYLLRYLRVRKFDCDKAYHNIRQSVHFKNKHPDFFFIEPNLESLLNRNFVVYLPYTDEEGNVIFAVDFANWNQEQTFAEICQVVTAVLDTIIENPKCQVNGVIGIYDFKTINRHLMATMITNMALPKYSFLIQNLYPWRITKGLVINVGPLGRMLYAMVRPLLSKKITERVVLIGEDLSELHQHVNPVLLPQKLGGTLDEEQCSVTQNVLDNIPFLKYQRTLV